LAADKLVQGGEHIIRKIHELNGIVASIESETSHYPHLNVIVIPDDLSNICSEKTR